MTDGARADGPTVRYRTEIFGSGGTTTGIPVPDEVLEALGGGKRIPVAVTIGSHTYQSTVTPYQGRVLISLSSENRAAAGVAAGDEVEVTLTRETGPRTVEVPEDLRGAVDEDSQASAFFASLPPSHQKAYVTWITDAKKEETRRSRIESAVAMLREGKRR